MIIAVGSGVSLTLFLLSNFIQMKIGTFTDAGLLKQISFHFLNACILGFGLGATGFFVGASIGDENAGLAAVQFGGFLLIAGFVLGFIVSFLWHKFIS